MVVAIVAVVVAAWAAIAIHELGRLAAARLIGLRIARVSLGYGRPLRQRTTARTTYQIGASIFGGRVDVRGVDGARRAAWRMAVVLLGGCVASYLAVSACVFSTLLSEGTPHGLVYAVRDTLPGYDAAGKLARGDCIIELDHEPISPDTGKGLTERVSDKGGRPVALTIRRDGQLREVAVTPKAAEDDNGRPLMKDGRPIYYLGIKPAVGVNLVDDAGAAAGAALGFPIEETERLTVRAWQLLRAIAVGKEKTDPGGPKRMFDNFVEPSRSPLPRIFAMTGFAALLIQLIVGLITLGFPPSANPAKTDRTPAVVSD